jgi:hypothetical protein
MKEFGCANLSDLSIDLMHSYVHDTALKALIAERVVDIESEDEAYTKYHCELAGESIEYSWGCAKNDYCL